MRKMLTVPSECKYLTQDNINDDLVLAKGDYIVKSDTTKFMAISLLGVGTFGQVFKCVSNEGEEVAIKVVKGTNRHYQYEMNELRILNKLRDSQLNAHFVELYDAFVYKQHLCIVVELLSKNMYDITKILRYQGMQFQDVRVVLKQILEGLTELHKLGIIHCDLKPENVLVADLFSYRVKIIDFGSAVTKTMNSSHFYVQSRFYRAPEVILGIPYSSAIDIWSFGCIAYELFTGCPLFQGSDNKDQILRIHEFFTDGLPQFMLEHGENTHEFFDKKNKFYARDNPNKFTIDSMVEKIYSRRFSKAENELFIDLILKALNPSYLERPPSCVLLNHPFFSYDYNSDHSPEEHRYQKNNLPPIPQSNRKMSMFNYSTDSRDKAFLQMRKVSAVEPEYENRSNRVQ
jgi:dual specificity protein kinase YAK1